MIDADIPGKKLTSDQNQDSSGVDSEQQRREAVKKFKDSRDKPITKQNPFQKPILRYGLPILAGALAVAEVGGITYDVAKNQVPISAHTLKVDALHPWDFGLEINKPNKESPVLGQRYATPAEMQAFIQSPLPVEKPDSEIKTPADLPQVGIIASTDLSKSGKVECFTTDIVVGGGPLVGQPVPEYLNYTYENKNSPLGLFIPQGVNTDNVEILLQKPDIVNGQPQYNRFFEKFDLGNNQYCVVCVSMDFLPTDILKNAPIVDVDHPPTGMSWPNYLCTQQGEKVNIADDPTLANTKDKNSTAFISTYNSGNSHLSVPYAQTENGYALFSQPH
jgi:hypothetical protein